MWTRKHFQYSKGVLFLVITFLIIMLGVTKADSKTVNAPVGENEYIFFPIILFLPCGFVDEQEPNDTFEEADGPLLPGVAYLGCFSETSDINDIYYIELNTPSDIEVNLQNIGPGHDYDIALYDANEKLEDFSATPGNEDEHILAVQKAAQKYFIQVYNYGRTASHQPYQLWVEYDAQLECDLLAITEDVFLQLKDVPGQHPIYGSNPVDGPNFQCDAVFSPVYDELLAIRIEYTNVGENWGFWGINISPAGYDASGFNEICVRAYAENPLQTFYLKLKDMTEDHTEAQFPITVDNNEPWKEYCVPLSLYGNENEGVRIDLLENVNIGFDQNSGSATVIVDGFLFK